jgi:cytochrome b561
LKKKISITLLLFSLLSFPSYLLAQSEDLFTSIREDVKSDESLLPDRMIFTQRFLWGENGLFRITGISPLNTKQREKELKLRRSMLKIHQIIGYLTLAGMVTQGFLGGKLYNNWEEGLYRTHKTVGNLTTLSYFTGAGLSLFSPPPLINKKYKGLNSIKAHKYLASIHFSAMVTTGIFKNRNKKIHKYSAYTAVGSFAAAMLVFKFN